MAPEVVLQKNMGRPLDIWSVGCVVVEMFTGKVQYTVAGTTGTVIMCAHFVAADSMGKV